jgi:type I restriction enzyme S subunit
MALQTTLTEQIQSLQQQNQELTTLRDWLLPMLMSGQVRVG